MRSQVTKLQVGVAACALTVAFAVPTVAQAQPLSLAPQMPVSQLVGQVSGVPLPAAPFGCADGDVGCVVIGGFSALVIGAVDFIVVPLVAALNAFATFVRTIFQIGPYGTGRA